MGSDSCMLSCFGAAASAARRLETAQTPVRIRTDLKLPCGRGCVSAAFRDLFAWIPRQISVLC